VPTSTFGVGADFDERLLREIAQEGGGNFYFIESPVQIADLLTSELGEALEVVARDAELHLAVPTGVVAQPLNRLRFAGGRGDALRISLGDLVSAQELRLIVKLRFPAGAVGESVAVGVQLADRDGVVSGPVEACEWRFADHGDNEAQPRDAVVDREVAALYAARARAEATEANRAGDFDRARRVLEQTADRIRGYAYGDPALEAVRRALLDDVDGYAARAMSPMQLKSAFYVAESFGKGRGPDGKARRRPSQ
jgi:Ca-activated chloride channel family protein